jgi:hypothetical protein
LHIVAVKGKKAVVVLALHTMVSQGILYMGLASGIISFTISEAKIFEWWRNWIKDKNTFLSDLFNCGFCLSFWVCALLEIIYRPNLFNKIPVVDNILTIFVMTFISGMVWGLLCFIMKMIDK